MEAVIVQCSKNNLHIVIQAIIRRKGVKVYRRLSEVAHRTRQIVYFLDPVWERKTKKKNNDKKIW